MLPAFVWDPRSRRFRYTQYALIAIAIVVVIFLTGRIGARLMHWLAVIENARP
jgi:hypothetical protein